MAENAFSYYPNALCFQDKSKITLKNNWFDNTFSNIYIAIEACDSVQNGEKCKEKGEISKFLDDNIFYYVL